jgi:hypothetical protein
MACGKFHQKGPDRMLRSHFAEYLIQAPEFAELFAESETRKVPTPASTE